MSTEDTTPHVACFLGNHGSQSVGAARFTLKTAATPEFLAWCRAQTGVTAVEAHDTWANVDPEWNPRTVSVFLKEDEDEEVLRAVIEGFIRAAEAHLGYAFVDENPEAHLSGSYGLKLIWQRMQHLPDH